MADHDPLTVRCPSCQAPAGTACRVDNPHLAEFGHADRRERARLAAVEVGTCGLCGQTMLRALDPIDAWHPHTVATPCPPEPSTEPYDGPGWFKFYGDGLTPGRPGVEHFIPKESHAESDDDAAPADPN